MPIEVTPHLLHLITDAALKSFWRKQTLRHFLRRCGISQSALSSWAPEETKRDFLDRTLPLVERSPKASSVISKMARTLAEQTSFPDLDNWEDSAEKKRQATEAVNALRQYLARAQESAEQERERLETQRRAREIQERSRLQRQTLSTLEERLGELSGRLGSQKAGYDFQTWYYDLLDFFEVSTRRPYVIDGRQIDGSVTVQGTTYLNELKFTSDQAGAPDIDIFYRKVQEKADNTMGIMLSISGYSSTAIDAASGPRTPLLLLDHSHLYMLLTGGMTFTELIDRVRRHASQTSRAYLAVRDFNG
ncbi:MAG: hypothetical protein ACLGQX_01800 [Acidobacteriota bacterium]